MKRTLPTDKGAAVYDANCEHPDCAFWAQGRQEAAAQARAHARETGHRVTCTTMVTYTYNPRADALSEERP